MRGCNLNGCSTWSEVRLIDVGRLRGDFNGDGYGDVAIAAHRETTPTGSGRVHVFFGGTDGLSGSRVQSLSSPSANGTYQSFGLSVTALDDFNGNGYSDLAISEGTGTSLGRVHIYVGGGAGGLYTAGRGFVEIDGSPSADGGGGDVDGDGLSDLGTGAPQETVDGVMNAGAAYTLYGTMNLSACSPPCSSISSRRLVGPSTPAMGDYFGRTSALFDTNGDGNAEIFVSAPFQRVDIFDRAGRVYVYADATGAPSIVEHPAPQVSAEFGAQVARLGDVNRDGFGDVLVLSSNPARGYVLLGGRGGTTVAGTSVPAAGDADAIGAGDVNGDGHDDVVIRNGTPATTFVSVFLGTDLGPQASSHRDLAATTSAYASGLGRWGTITDVNGDGYADVIVSAMTETVGGVSNAGGAYVFLGAADGPAATTTMVLRNPTASAGSAYFGWDGS
ncbi:MAG: FG-GAP-like repeat-containing protein [Sandaracinaceae bacterium]|nr:FG-GAP-like repeat-containing protein [Sandaracinaceae bacterium]